MPYAKYVSLVEQLAGVKLLVVGDAMLDHYVVGAVDRISPEAPVPILNVQEEFDRVGGAANVAANAVSLGASVELVCLAGRDRSDDRDPDAERLYDKCKALGFEPMLLRYLPCTIRKTRLLAGRQQMLRVDWEHHYNRTQEERDAALALGSPWEPLPLPPSAIEDRRKLLADLLPEYDAVLVSDYAKGMVDPDLMRDLRESGKPVIVDPRPQHAELYRETALVTPNRREAMEILGLSPRKRLPSEKLAAMISDALQCAALITLGEEGMHLHTLDGHSEHIPTRAREVFDVTGAGDTVAATVALALGAGLNLSQAAHLANAAAGVVVAHVGTATVTPDELRAALTPTDS